MVFAKLLGDESMDSGLGQSREHTQSGNNTLDTGERDSREKNRDVMALKSLLTDFGASSVSHLRWVFFLSSFQILPHILNVRLSKLIRLPLLQREAAWTSIRKCRAAGSPERTKIY